MNFELLCFASKKESNWQTDLNARRKLCDNSVTEVVLRCLIQSALILGHKNLWTFYCTVL